MRVLAIYPAFDVEMNEMAMVWDKLCSNNKVSCEVLTGVQDKLKGSLQKCPVEKRMNLQIHRFSHRLYASRRVLQIAERLRPDVIFCAVAHNLGMAKQLSFRTGAPVVLHNEFFLDNARLMTKRRYTHIEGLLPLIGNLYRRVLVHNSARILSSNPKEFELPWKQNYPSLEYLPWPHPIPSNGRLSFKDRDRDLAVYIGSLSANKGASELCRLLSCLLDEYPSFKLCLVGPTVDKVGKKALYELKRKGGSRVKLIAHCSRSDAYELLKRCLFVLSPGEGMGWGLIGDAWACATPIVSLHEHYDLKNGENCILVRNLAEFLDAVGILQDNAIQWEKLAWGGFRTVSSKHSMETVADVLLQNLSLAYSDAKNNYSSSMGTRRNENTFH